MNEAGLAVLRIYEPDPSAALREDDPEGDVFRLRYRGDDRL